MASWISLAGGAEWHVSPDGSNRNPGTRDQPFQTLEAARDAIRVLRSGNEARHQDGFTVWIHGGVHQRDEAFTLSSRDSGTARAPIVYRAVPGETVRLMEGRIVDVRHWKPLGKAARDRVHPGVDPDALYELDLNERDLGHVVEGFAPERRDGFPIDLFADERRQPVAQWPDRQENIKGINDPGWTSCNGSKDERTFYFGEGGTPQNNKDTANQLDLDGTHRSLRWKRAMDAGHKIHLKGFWRTPWAPKIISIDEINTDGKWIRLASVPPGGMGSKYTRAAEIEGAKQAWRVGSGQEKWLALNLLEEINQPGEWALDTRERKIYFLPPAPIESLSIMIADRKTPVVSLKGASHVSLAGMHLEGGLDAGVDVEGCSHVTIAGCTIRNVFRGIRIAKSSEIRIQSNDIHETGCEGIRIENVGDRRKLVSSNILVDNNHVHHVGRVYFTPFISIHTAVGITVSHNLMHDSPKGGVMHYDTNNCLYEYNEIHNIALKESDTGTFYGYGGWDTYGNVYRYNFTHHTNRANGFYCDDGNSGDIHYHNIVHDSITALKFGGGHDNIGRNNLLVANQAQRIDDRGVSRNYRLGTKYESRLRAFKPFEDPWRSYGRELQRKFSLTTSLWEDVLDADWHPEWPNGSAMTDNVAVANGPFQSPRHGRVTVAGNSIIETIEEAGFRDYAQMDLRTDNPTVLEKFPDLNTVFPKIGLRKDKHRLTVPDRREVGGLHNRGDGGDPWDEDQFVD